MRSKDDVIDCDARGVAMIAKSILIANDLGRIEDGVISKVGEKPFMQLETKCPFRTR